VIIGAAAGVLINPGGALLIGFFGGCVSTLCYEHLSSFLKEKLGIYDTCGVNNLHGIPGLLGGLISAAVCAFYIYPDSALSGFTLTSAEFPALAILKDTPYHQAALQVAGTFCSIGIAMVTGLISGIIISFVYSFRES